MSFSDVKLETETVGREGDHMLKCSRSRELTADVRLRNICFEEGDEK